MNNIYHFFDLFSDWDVHVNITPYNIQFSKCEFKIKDIYDENIIYYTTFILNTIPKEQLEHHIHNLYNSLKSHNILINQPHNNMKRQAEDILDICPINKKKKT